MCELLNFENLTYKKAANNAANFISNYDILFAHLHPVLIYQLI